MFKGTNIKKKIDVEEFVQFIKKYSEEQIECTEHTFFRLSEKQRKIYNYKELKRILFQMNPFLVGIQHNENYALFYKYQGKILKMIVSINDRKVNIVTFYFIEEWQIPKI